MVGRSEGFLVLYPIYFDSRASRAQGRRISASQAVAAPTAKVVFEAAKAAGLAPVLEDEHHHPASWSERSGRVLLPASSVDSKGEAISLVTEKLAAAQAAHGVAAAAKSHKGHKQKLAHKKRGRRRR